MYARMFKELLQLKRAVQHSSSILYLLKREGFMFNKTNRHNTDRIVKRRVLRT